MTEMEWLASKIPRWMFKALGSNPDNRKLRLLATACCRRLDALFSRAGAKALDTNERFADGAATTEELAAAERSAHRFYTSISAGVTRHSPKRARSDAAWAVWAALRQLPDDVESDDRPVHWAAAAVRMAGVALNPVAGPTKPAGLEGGTKTDRAEQADLMRDIFGNPFRPVAPDERWLTSTALGLAHGIYDDRAFDRLPILADALEDAGCEDARILSHCRGSGAHVRGCWVVDLVLEKG